MNERKGWVLLCVGVVLFFLACLGVSLAAFAWGSALMEGILG